jgi:hypothetical protein
VSAWGFQFNENDGAQDFLADVTELRDWSSVAACLTDYVDNGGYDDADEAVAASELVAAALGKPSPLLGGELATWAAQHSEEAAALRPVAANAVKLALSKSELNELWSEAEEYSDWQATLGDLISRLG